MRRHYEYELAFARSAHARRASSEELFHEMTPENVVFADGHFPGPFGLRRRLRRWFERLGEMGKKKEKKEDQPLFTTERETLQLFDSSYIPLLMRSILVMFSCK